LEFGIYMKLFPESAYIQLEFDKVKTLLAEHCRSEYAIEKANLLSIHTRIGFIETELRQSSVQWPCKNYRGYVL
jgi:DNA mismatch repair protein MutS2